MTKLKETLQAEINTEKNPKKKTKRIQELQYFKAWKEEEERRSENRQKRQKKKETALQNSQPPPYVPMPSVPEPQSKNPFTNQSNPYAQARHALNCMAVNKNPQEDIGKDPTGRDMGGNVDPPGPSELFPMIATPNPRYGQLTGGANNERDENPNIFVFRPWSQTDRQNVLKDVPSLNEGFIQWREAVELIRRQWYLNGHEMLQVIQDLLGLKMGTVRENFTGSDENGRALDPGFDDLQAAITHLYERIRVHLAPRAVNHFAKIWQNRGMITSTGKRVQHGDLLKALLEVITLPKQLALCKCAAHQKDNSEVTKGNNFTDQAA